MAGKIAMFFGYYIVPQDWPLRWSQEASTEEWSAVDTAPYAAGKHTGRAEMLNQLGQRVLDYNRKK